MQIQLGKDHDQAKQRDDPADHKLHRQILICPRRSGRCGLAASKIGKATLQSMPDCWQRPKQADDATGSDGASPDVQHVGAANLIRAHLANGNRSGR